MESCQLTLYELAAVRRLRAMKKNGHTHIKMIDCGKCAQCIRDDCKKCINCLDKPRFGGEGIRKQKCVAKRCLWQTPIVTKCVDIAYSPIPLHNAANDTLFRKSPSPVAEITSSEQVITPDITSKYLPKRFPVSPDDTIQIQDKCIVPRHMRMATCIWCKKRYQTSDACRKHCRIHHGVQLRRADEMRLPYAE